MEFYGQPGMSYVPPLHESAPRIPAPYASLIFYYPQIDTLHTLHQNRQTWTFCETRPDLIIGYAPRSNGMGMAQALALWLAMYASFEGQGSEVVFPGSEAAWTHLHSDTSQDVLARFTIHASLLPHDDSRVAGKAFNIADG